MNFAERLIDEVKSHEILYNLSLPDYKNPAARNSVWKDISHRLGVPQEHAKKKWKNLRDTYRRSNRLELQSGSTSVVKSRKWKYFEQMQFFDQFDRTTLENEKIRNVREVSPETVGDAFDVLCPEYSSLPPPSKMRKYEAAQEQFCNLLQTASQQLTGAYSSSTNQLFDALATRVKNSGLTDDETGFVELAVTECVINSIKKIKNMRM